MLAPEAPELRAQMDECGQPPSGYLFLSDTRDWTCG